MWPPELNVLVFQTDLYTKREVTEVCPLLDSLSGLKKWTIDLDDCDHVLRVVGTRITGDMIITTLGKVGFTAELLPSNPNELKTVKRKPNNHRTNLIDLLGYACPEK
jgi:hypothetical protein